MRIISGAYRGRRLLTPKGQETRPTSDRLRESIFNILAHNWPQHLKGARVADIFAGSGALGIEALSRGAAHVVFVEKHPAGRELVASNLDLLGITDGAEVIAGDARQLPRGQAAFDLIFMDPPYRRGLGEAALAALPEAGWLRPDTLLVLETASDEESEIPAGYEVADRRVQGDSQVIFLLWKGE
jgi:16S rRNA (guanine966-N2)-methyltransferase